MVKPVIVSPPTGAVSTYTYDAAGQLVRLVDSEAGVSEFVYDGFGRRVQHRGADGLVREYGFSPVGLLAQVSDDGAPVVSGFGAGVAGLEVLGTRAYDPVSRGFLSSDPVVSPVGAGWGANVYSFVGNAPSVLVDPWGLSPVSAARSGLVNNIKGRGIDAGVSGFLSTVNYLGTDANKPKNSAESAQAFLKGVVGGELKSKGAATPLAKPGYTPAAPAEN